MRNFRAEFQRNPALARRALEMLPPGEGEPERVLIRCDAAHVGEAIARAIALAGVNGEVVKVELAGDSNAHTEI